MLRGPHTRTPAPGADFSSESPVPDAPHVLPNAYLYIPNKHLIFSLSRIKI